jgi:hypothetical protein
VRKEGKRSSGDAEVTEFQRHIMPPPLENRFSTAEVPPDNRGI